MIVGGGGDRSGPRASNEEETSFPFRSDSTPEPDNEAGTTHVHSECWSCTNHRLSYILVHLHATTRTIQHCTYKCN